MLFGLLFLSLIYLFSNTYHRFDYTTTYQESNMAIRLILMPASSRKKRKDVENLILRKTPGLTRQQFKRDKHKAISDYVADQLVEMFQQSSSQAGVCRKHIEGGRT